MQLQLFIKLKQLFLAAIYSAPFFIATSALASPLSSTEESFPLISCPPAPQITPTSGEPPARPPEPVPGAVHDAGDFLPSVIRGLVEVNQIDAALYLVSSITDIEEQQQQYLTVLMTLIDMEAYEQLEEVMTQTETQNITLQPQQLHRLVSTLMAAGEHDLMLELIQTINDPALQDQARQQIASGLAEAGDFEQAQDVIQDINSSTSQAIALMDSAKALDNLGRREEARIAFESAQQQAASIDNTRDYLSVLVYITETLATLGWVDEALEMLSQMPTLTTGAPLEFENRYERRKVEILLTISNYLFDSGNTERANQIIQEAIDNSFNLEFWDTRLLTDEIATQLITYQQFDRLFEWNRIANANRVWLGHKVVPLLAQNNHIDLALEFIERDPEGADLLGLLVENSYRQNPDRAYKIALTIQDERTRTYRLSNMASYFARVGAYERVIAIAQYISTIQSEASRLELLAQDLGRVEEYEHAAQVVGLIANSQQREEACQTIRIQATENLVNANQIEQALQVASTITLPSQREQALLRIAIALFRQGEEEQALALAEPIQGSSTRSRAFENFISTSVRVGNYEQALQFTQEISGESRRSQSLQVITRQLISEGQYDRALEIIGMSSSERRQAEDWSTLAMALIESGEIDRGFDILNQALAIANLPPLP